VPNPVNIEGQVSTGFEIIRERFNHESYRSQLQYLEGLLAADENVLDFEVSTDPYRKVFIVATDRRLAIAGREDRDISNCAEKEGWGSTVVNAS